MRSVPRGKSTFTSKYCFSTGLSENARPVFSENGSKLYFGIAPAPILNDTTLLPEEIVNVEVWSWTENRMYTQQKVQLESDKKRSYPVVWHSAKNKFVPLGSLEAVGFCEFGAGFAT